MYEYRTARNSLQINISIRAKGFRVDSSSIIIVATVAVAITWIGDIVVIIVVTVVVGVGGGDISVSVLEEGEVGGT